MSNKIPRLLILALVNFFCLSLVSSKSGGNFLLKSNVFFQRCTDLLVEIEKEQDSADQTASDQKSPIQEIKSFLNSLRFSRFSCYGISSLGLDKLLRQLDAHRNRFEKSDNGLSDEDTLKKLNTAFDLMIKGICCDLSFDHLIVFRDSLISYLKKISFLIEYWTNELDKDSLWDVF